MKIKELEFFILLIISFLLMNAVSYSQSDKIKISVQIVFDSEDAGIIEKRMESFIKRELRSLGDVEIVDKDEYLILRIMGMDSKVNNRKVGFAISTISLMPTFCNNNPSLNFWASSMFLTREESLKSTSEDIVAWFDQDSIESVRKFNKSQKLK